MVVRVKKNFLVRFPAMALEKVDTNFNSTFLSLPMITRGSEFQMMPSMISH
jgi:hypothetical protein